MTDIDVYQPAAGLSQYQAGIIMTPEQAKALDDQVRACTRAVLREGTDYGVIPGTDGKPNLWRPGAQKLLQWFGLGFTCDRIETDLDDDGRKQGVTYKCTVFRQLPDGSKDVKATCEGYAGYDEDKFYQPAEQAQAKAEARERKWAEHDRRPANPNKWKHVSEYRAPWNSVVKRSQKRAIVGATVDATAAGGLFGAEDDDDAPVADNGSTWYEQALEDALSFTDIEAGRTLYAGAAQAHRDGLCTRRQQDHIQNRITQRVRLLKNATPVDAEDLARQAAAGEPEPDPTPPAGPAATATGTGSSTAPAADGPSDKDGTPEHQPGSATEDQLQSLHIILGALGFTSADREHKLKIAETITGRAPLTGPEPGRSSKNLSLTEARKLIDTLDGFGGDRDALIAFMAEAEQAGEGDE
jgi:hypothetical protein